MSALTDAIRAEIESRAGRRDELERELAAVESDIESLEDMLALAEGLEPKVEPVVVEAPPALPARASRRKKIDGDLGQRIVKVLEASPVLLRRGEIERELGLSHGQSKDALARLVKAGEVYAVGERAGRRYGPPGADPDGAPAKAKKPPLPQEPPGTWQRDSETGDSEPSRSCRVGDCVRVARQSGFCDEHAHMAGRFPVAA